MNNKQYDKIIIEASKCFKQHKTYDGMIKCLKQKGYENPENQLTGLTLDEVGYIMGITRERVRQIEQSALRKLRLFSYRYKKLSDFF